MPMSIQIIALSTLSKSLLYIKIQMESELGEISEMRELLELTTRSS